MRLVEAWVWILCFFNAIQIYLIRIFCAWRCDRLFSLRHIFWRNRAFFATISFWECFWREPFVIKWPSIRHLRQSDIIRCQARFSYLFLLQLCQLLFRLLRPRWLNWFELKLLIADTVTSNTLCASHWLIWSKLGIIGSFDIFSNHFL